VRSVHPNGAGIGVLTHLVAFEVMSATKHFYDIVTAHYVVLFGPSTPLHWNLDEDRTFDLLGRNPNLRRAFETVRTEARKFCKKDAYLQVAVMLMQSRCCAYTFF
jgi:hypothetical protein